MMKTGRRDEVPEMEMGTLAELQISEHSWFFLNKGYMMCYLSQSVYPIISP